MTAQSTSCFANDYIPAATSAANCTGYAEIGQDRVHSISIPAGKTLTATITPITADDVGMYLLANVAACTAAPQMCLIGEDVGGPGEVDVLVYANSGITPITVLLVVDSYDTGNKTYDLTIAIQ